MQGAFARGRVRRETAAFAAVQKWLGRGLALLALGLVPLAPASAETLEVSVANSLFGGHPLVSLRPELLPKWAGVLERYSVEQRRAAEDCRVAAQCDVQLWFDILAGLRSEELREQVEAVNRYVNEAPYVPDDVNYHRLDYWATPWELFRRGGDCEDYALAKFFALRALGLSGAKMRLMIVQDLELGRPHAVLAVNVDGEILVLDNQTAAIIPARDLNRYASIYSVNEHYWWLHAS